MHDGRVLKRVQLRMRPLHRVVLDLIISYTHIGGFSLQGSHLGEGFSAWQWLDLRYCSMMAIVHGLRPEAMQEVSPLAFREGVNCFGEPC